MQAFLIICAICLQLNNNLPNIDPQALEQRDIACNQCLTGLNGPSKIESPITMEMSCPGEPQQCNCMSSDSKAMSERTLEVDEVISKEISAYGKEIGTILEGKKSSLASLIHHKMQELTMMVRYQSSKMPNYQIMLDLLKEEEARLIEIYTGRLDEVMKMIAVGYDPVNPDPNFVNEFAIMIWQFSYKIERVLLNRRIETLRKHLEQIEKTESSLEEVRMLIERKGIPTKFKATLMVHQVLSPGDFLTSENGMYEAVMQLDGNFVVYDLLYRPRWHASTYGFGKKMHMRPDGNLAIYNVNGDVVWSTGTQKIVDGTMHYVKLENDGRLMIYHSEGHIVKEITV